MKLAQSLFEPVISQISAEHINRPSTTMLQDAWRRFKQNKLAMAGLITLAGLIIFAFIGPFLIKYNYYTNDLMNTYLKPSWSHPFGTDSLGRDSMARLMYGGRVSLAIGFVSVLINLSIGVFYGGISGYFGGRIDNIMMRIIDVIYSIPRIIVCNFAYGRHG